jgi:uncharacterized protein (UPF0333 family)
MRENQKGQTSIEYIFLVVVIVVVMGEVFSRIEEFLIRNPNSVYNQYINSFTDSFGEEGSRYKFFTIRR